MKAIDILMTLFFQCFKYEAINKCAQSQDVPSTNVSHVEIAKCEDTSLLTMGASKSHLPHPNRKPRPGCRYIVKGPKRRAEY